MDSTSNSTSNSTSTVLIDQHLETGEFKLLVAAIQKFKISDLRDFELYSHDIIDRVIQSRKFKNSYIRKITYTIDNMISIHHRTTLANQLLEYLKTDQIDQFSGTLKKLREISGSFDFRDINKPVMEAWSEYQYHNFAYIKTFCLRGDQSIVLEVINGFMLIVAFCNVDLAIDFVSYCGYDIYTIHLDSSIKYCLDDPRDYDDVFDDLDKDILDKLCDWCKKSSNRPIFFIKNLLMQWALNYYGDNTDLLEELYVNTDPEFRYTLFVCGMYVGSTNRLQFMGRFGEIKLSDTMIEQILTWCNCDTIDIIMDHTNFLEKITNAPSDSTLNKLTLIKIVHRLKN